MDNLTEYQKKQAAIEFAIESVIRDTVFSTAGKAEALDVLYDELHKYRSLVEIETERAASINGDAQ